MKFKTWLNEETAAAGASSGAASGVGGEPSTGGESSQGSGGASSETSSPNTYNGTVTKDIEPYKSRCCGAYYLPFLRRRKKRRAKKSN